MESIVAADVGEVHVTNVNHHGSANSSNTTWVNTLNADHAVFSVGANGHGHPAQEAVDRWSAAGTTLWQTHKGGPAAEGGSDLEDGDVVITTDGLNAYTIAGSHSSHSATFSLTDGGEQPAQDGAASTFDGDPATVDGDRLTDPAGYSIAVSAARFAAADSAAHVVLASADVFADALAGSPLAADGPMLLTNAALADGVNAEIDRVLPAGGRVYVLGGENAVPSDLLPTGYDVRRLSGPSRIETAVAVAGEVRALYGPGDGTVLLARAFGDGSAAFADSLTVGGFAAHRRLPLLLTSTAALHPATQAALGEFAPSRTVLLGGVGALSGDVEQAVPAPQRVSGAARDVTAIEISNQLWGDTATGERVVIDGFDGAAFQWGLPLAGLSADTRAPLLVTASQLPDSTREAVTVATGDMMLVGAFPNGNYPTVRDAIAAAVQARGGSEPAPVDPGCVDINSENDLDELQRIVHIGSERAQQLIDRRPYDNLDQLARIDGIGPARVQDIKDQGLAAVSC